MKYSPDSYLLHESSKFITFNIRVKVVMKDAVSFEVLKETAYHYLTDKHDLEYLEILNRNNLEEEKNANNHSIALIACRVDGVRLIDNIYFSEV